MRSLVCEVLAVLFLAGPALAQAEEGACGGGEAERELKPFIMDESQATEKCNQASLVGNTWKISVRDQEGRTLALSTCEALLRCMTETARDHLEQSKKVCEKNRAEMASQTGGNNRQLLLAQADKYEQVAQDKDKLAGQAEKSAGSCERAKELQKKMSRKYDWDRAKIDQMLNRLTEEQKKKFLSGSGGESI